MSKRLSKEIGLRMWGGAGGSGSGGGGGLDPSALAGYATQSWVNEGFVSKPFLSEMFTVHGKQTVTVKRGTEVISTTVTDITLSPNETSSTVEEYDDSTGLTTITERTIDSIESKVGFWTRKYVSALGQNASGSGGGGSSTLAGLNDVEFVGSPSEGQVLKYNASTHKWYNATDQAGTGTVTSVGMTVPTGFSVSPSSIQSTGTFAITFATGYSLPTTANQNQWDNAYSWVNTNGQSVVSNSHTHSNKNVLDGISSTDVSHWDTAYDDHHTHSNKNVLDGITSTKVSNWDTAYSKVGTIEGYFDADGNAKSALKLTTVSKTAWGQTYWTSGGVPDSISGNMTDVGSIAMNGSINGPQSIEMNSGGGQSSNGGFIDFHYAGQEYGGVLNDYSLRLIEQSNGVLTIQGRNASNTAIRAAIEVGPGTYESYIRIGNGVIIWDNTNNALKVQKYDGTSANFYALGGVSALGQNSGGGGGGSSTLAGLTDVNLTSPSSGQYLKYNGTHWVNADLPATGVTSVGMTVPTGFSVSPSSIQSTGTFAISFGGNLSANKVLATPDGSSGAPSWRLLTSDDIPSLAAGKITSGTFAAARIPNLDASKITSGTFEQARIPDKYMIKTSHDTTVDIDTLYDAGSHRFGATASGTWPTDVTANYGQMLVVRGGGDTVAQMFFPYGNSRAYIRCGNPSANSGSWRAWKTVAFLTDNVASATKLETSRSLWGQSFNGTADVSGNMSNVGNIAFSASGKNIGGLIYFDTTNNRVGIGISTPAHTMHVSSDLYSGGDVGAYGDITATWGNIKATTGTASMDDGRYIQIGQIRIVYDYTNNALKVIKADGTSAANFYATGGMSALGQTDNSNNIQVSTLTATTSVTTPILYLTKSGGPCYIYAEGTDIKAVINGTTYKLTKTTV